MIFYTAIAEDGTTQLRGTQADARAVNKQFEQIDIPTDKAGLMDFVQQLYAEIDELRRDIAVEVGAEPAPAPSAQPVAPPAPPPSPAEPDELPDEDEDKFDARILEEQVGALGLMGVEALDRFDGWMERVGVGAAFSRGVHLLNVICSQEHQLAKLFLRDKMKKRKFG